MNSERAACEAAFTAVLGAGVVTVTALAMLALVVVAIARLV